jgi:hypothetical protein
MTNGMSVVNEESQSQTSFASFLTEFTKKIDQYETCDWKTSNQLHSNLWSDISRVRREIAADNTNTNKNALHLQLFPDWKYKNSFELTEKNHEDHQQLFKDLPWEQSFVLAFLYFTYH